MSRSRAAAGGLSSAPRPRQHPAGQAGADSPQRAPSPGSGMLASPSAPSPGIPPPPPPPGGAPGPGMPPPRPGGMACCIGGLRARRRGAAWRSVSGAETENAAAPPTPKDKDQGRCGRCARPRLRGGPHLSPGASEAPDAYDVAPSCCSLSCASCQGSPGRCRHQKRTDASPPAVARGARRGAGQGGDGGREGRRVNPLEHSYGWRFPSWRAVFLR